MQETFKSECSVHMRPLRVYKLYYNFFCFSFFSSENRLVKINDGMKGGNCKPSDIARKIAQAFSFNWRDSGERFVLFYIGVG